MKRSMVKSLAIGLVLLTSGFNAGAQMQPISATYRPIQVSLVPNFGTNWTLSSESSNAVSLNLIGGVSKEVRAFEAGGVVNIVKGDVRYYQVSGVVNLVSGNNVGFQSAGVLNRTNSVKGYQSSGVANLVNENVEGFQAAGVVNRTKDVKGFQMAGVVNLTSGFVLGFQGAGVANQHLGNFKGVQLSGVSNSADSVNGAQLSGVANSAKFVKGVQLGGVFNMACDVKGSQIGGVVNIAKHVSGVQIGIVNIADSCGGVPIGLFNIIKNGYQQLELSGDETFYTNIAYRSGVKRLHSIVSAGIRPDKGNPTLWTIGYGMGTSQNISPKTLLDVDLSYNQIAIDGKFDEDNKLFRLYIGIDRHLFKNVSIAAGATANALFYCNSDVDNVAHMDQLIPYTIYKHKINDSKSVAGWVGGKIAIRFN